MTSNATSMRAWPDVAQVVDRDAADVHADLARFSRLEGDLAPEAGVVQAQRG